MKLKSFFIVIFTIIFITPVISFADDYNENKKITSDFLEVSSRFSFTRNSRNQRKACCNIR